MEDVQKQNKKEHSRGQATKMVGALLRSLGNELLKMLSLTVNQLINSTRLMNKRTLSRF